MPSGLFLVGTIGKFPLYHEFEPHKLIVRPTQPLSVVTVKLEVVRLSQVLTQLNKFCTIQSLQKTCPRASAPDHRCLLLLQS